MNTKGNNWLQEEKSKGITSSSPSELDEILLGSSGKSIFRFFFFYSLYTFGGKTHHVGMHDSLSYYDNNGHLRE